LGSRDQKRNYFYNFEVKLQREREREIHNYKTENRENQTFQKMGSFGVPLPAERWSLQGKNALVTVGIGYKIFSQIKLL
jgi:hypothetical protein